MTICPKIPRLVVVFICLLSIVLPFPISVFAEAPQQIFYEGPAALLKREAELFNESKINGAQVSKISTTNYDLTTGPTFAAAYLIPIRRCDIAPELCEAPTAVSTLTHIMAAIYSHPPASAIAWTHHTLANAGLAKPVYAQGIGFAALSPFLPLWQVTRNIAYSLLIIVMIVIGFMLIFRTQIDAHTVISVQAAIPKIIMTILIITFSYPIVGFLVDLMYLAIALVVSVFLSGIPGNKLADLGMAEWQSSMMTGNMGTLFTTVYGVGLRSVDDFWKFWKIGAGSVGIGGLIGWMIGVGTIGLGAAIGFIAPIGIIILLLGLGLLFVFIRLLMLLANAYIQVIISLILGPLLLLNEAIPGRSAFKEWLFNIMANLSVFPATAMILMFATFLTSSGVGGSWSPPFLPNWSGAGQGFFGAFLGICIIFLAPNLVVSVKKVFTPKPALPIGAGTLFSPITGGAQTTMGMASQYYYFQQLGHGPLGRMFSKFGGGNHGATAPGGGQS